MRILRKHRATLVRHNGDGAFNEDGKWVESQMPTTVEIPCCIQPASDPSVKVLIPTSVREKHCKIVYTAIELQGVSEIQNIVADKLIINGESYEVFEVGEWNGAGRIKAWMAVCVREDET
jgi:hypothetical protein